MVRKSNEYDIRHKRNIKIYELRLDGIYNDAIREAVSIKGAVGRIKPDKPFSFSDYPNTRKRIERLMSGLKTSIEGLITDGIKTEWTLANNKNDELANRLFGKKADKMTAEQRRRYYSTNDAARKAFQQRKTAGLNLSDRVWRYTEQFKEEIEMGLDIGIRSGRSADDLSRDLRQYLRQPDKLFRRVRDEHGQLQLSKRAKAYHPGQGVYRSSYKNARRLTATETNMAYRASDHLRWQQMDFVVGIEIHLSNNHTLNGKPFRDICDDLQGRYPKDFVFKGWHPLCRCFATSILKTPEEIAEDTRKILNGEPVDGKSVNRVDDVPDAFKEWVIKNSERIAKSSNLPYFLRDNEKYMNNVLYPQDSITAFEEKLYQKWDAFGMMKRLDSNGKDYDKVSEWRDNLWEAEDATSQIFNHKYVKKDWDVLVDEVFAKHLTEKQMAGDDVYYDPLEKWVGENGVRQTVKVLDLRPTQPWVGEPMNLIPYEYKEQKEPIALIQIEGTERYYIVNGHHRAIAKILWEKKTVEAYVYKAPKTLIKKLSKR